MKPLESQCKTGPTADVTVAFENVTPQIADKWLEDNLKRQRPIKPASVEKYTMDMRNDKWLFDGATICFDKRGKLIDGQHRLNALIKANMSLPFLIVRGLNYETFLTKDTGKVRLAADILAIDGHKEIRTVLARFLRLIVATNYGDKTYRRGLNSSSNRSITNQDIQGALDNLGSEAILYARKFKSKDYINTRRLLGAGDAAYFMWLTNPIDPDLSKNFFEKLETGEGLNKGDPLLTLRNKLITDVSLSRGNRHVKILKAAYLIKTWNALRQNKPLMVLRYADTENFPQLI